MNIFVNYIFIRSRSIMKCSMRCTHMEWCSVLTFTAVSFQQTEWSFDCLEMLWYLILLVGWFMFLNKIYNSHINISVVSTGPQLKCQSPGGCEDQLLILLLTNSKFNYFHQDFSHGCEQGGGVVLPDFWSISIWDQILGCFYPSLTATLRYFNSDPSTGTGTGSVLSSTFPSFLARVLYSHWSRYIQILSSAPFSSCAKVYMP